jgi:hypothetical protein
MQKTVLHNQSVLDCSLQHTGSLNKLFEFVIANGISITDELKAGDVYEFPAVDDAEIYNYFNIKNIIPATGITDEAINELETLGIGAMAIESTFIVR